MPIFEFVCLDCGESFDKLTRSSFVMSDINCPSCESHEVRKKLSLFSSKVSGGTRGATSTTSCAPGGL
ncbi:MAG: FmdB family zinc ribbon protein [Candidatus Promineifilaceae bacterium]|jgi:putative FmdB family regulatory protein